MYENFKKQIIDFKVTFETFIKETLGEEYFSNVSMSNTLGILSVCVDVYKGDKDKCKNDSCYYLNAPHFHWHIQTGEYHYFAGETVFKSYSKMSADLSRTSKVLAKYRKISVKTTDKGQAEPKQLFIKLEKWISKNKGELFKV